MKKQMSINPYAMFLAKYNVAIDGTITHKTTGKVRKPTICKGRAKNYHKINVRILGTHTTILVHRAVCYRYNPIPYKDVLAHEVEHLDQDTMNNHASNLCWIDPTLNKYTWRK